MPGPTVTLSAERADAMDADGLVVPGVGAFAACMRGLLGVHGAELIGSRLAGGRPVLGICVGMQVLFERGVEHGVETPRAAASGPGRWSGCRRPSYPTWGGTPSTCPTGSALFAGIEDERFYFVHSYAVRDWDLVTTGPHPRRRW